jgi:hypothetical protein
MERMNKSMHIGMMFMMRKNGGSCHGGVKKNAVDGE